MSIYGEGEYECSTHGHVAPGPRAEEQLLARQWEVPCPDCGEALAPVGTRETKPLIPTSIYAITKRDHEELCLVVGAAYGIPTVALRFFNVYGPGQALSNPYTGVAAIFASRLLNGMPPLIFEDGEQSRDFIHVSDIVSGITSALTSDEADGTRDQPRHRQVDQRHRDRRDAGPGPGARHRARVAAPVPLRRYPPLLCGHHPRQGGARLRGPHVAGGGDGEPARVAGGPGGHRPSRGSSARAGRARPDALSREGSPCFTRGGRERARHMDDPGLAWQPATPPRRRRGGCRGHGVEPQTRRQTLDLRRAGRRGGTGRRGGCRSARVLALQCSIWASGPLHEPITTRLPTSPARCSGQSRAASSQRSPGRATAITGSALRPPVGELPAGSATLRVECYIRVDSRRKRNVRPCGPGALRAHHITDSS